MQALDKVLKRIGTNRYDDDFVDRLNYKYTPFMLASFAVTIAAKQYVGQPLQCWVPAQFKGEWETYSENFCFVENTYYVGMDEPFPRDAAERERRELKYYQWVWLMLAAQLFFFMMPKTIWNAFNWKTGINLNALSKAVRPIEKNKEKQTVLKGENYVKPEIVKQFSTVLRHNKAQKKIWQEHKRLIKSSPQSFVTYFYLLFKFLNLLNCLGQLFFLNKFLGPEYNFWGYGILVDLINNRSWLHSGHFPRVTFCDVNVREQGGHIIRHTMQCVLAVNMFNEKIYIFIWFWLVILAVLNMLNIAYWISVSFNRVISVNFIKRYLAIDDDNRVNYFAHKTLGRDGITCLRLISQNCGDLAVTSLVKGLWDNNKQDYFDNQNMEQTEVSHINSETIQRRQQQKHRPIQHPHDAGTLPKKQFIGDNEYQTPNVNPVNMAPSMMTFPMQTVNSNMNIVNELFVPALNHQHSQNPMQNQTNGFNEITREH